MDVYDYSVEVGLPYRHVQIDSWYVNISFPSAPASTPARCEGLKLTRTVWWWCAGVWVDGWVGGWGVLLLHCVSHRRWYIKGASGGTKTWSPANGTFPPVTGGQAHSGLQRLHNATGWVYTAHNRMWAGDTTYAKQNGGQFDFTVAGGTSLPMTQDFWMWLIGDSVKWGLQMYEQDCK
jgi:hypothetical protein